MCVWWGEGRGLRFGGLWGVLEQRLAVRIMGRNNRSRLITWKTILNNSKSHKPPNISLCVLVHVSCACACVVCACVRARACVCVCMHVLACVRVRVVGSGYIWVW